MPLSLSRALHSYVVVHRRANVLLLRAHRRCSVVSGGRCINASRPGSQWSRKRTNAGMRRVTMAGKIARSALPPRPRTCTALGGAPPGTSLEASTSAVCRARQVGIGIASRVAVRCIAAGIGSSCSGCSLRKLKFIIEIRALQSTCLQIGKAAICSSIAICTTCLLPWYLPQSRSRWDWRRRGPLLGDGR